MFRARWLALLIAVLAASFLCFRSGLLRRSPFDEPSREVNSGCPLFTWLVPKDHTPLQPADFIEFRALYGGPFAGNPIMIKVFPSGRIERDTTMVGFHDFILGCPLHPEDRVITVAPEKARALLDSARNGGFCRLCREYQMSGFIYDGGSESITLSVHGKLKRVEVANSTPPHSFKELADGIWRLSPMDKFANPKDYTPARAAECEAFYETQLKLHPKKH